MSFVDDNAPITGKVFFVEQFLEEIVLRNVLDASLLGRLVESTCAATNLKLIYIYIEVDIEIGLQIDTIHPTWALFFSPAAYSKATLSASETAANFLGCVHITSRLRHKRYLLSGELRKISNILGQLSAFSRSGVSLDNQEVVLEKIILDLCPLCQCR